MKNPTSLIFNIKKTIFALVVNCALFQSTTAQNLTLANVAPVTGDSLFYREGNYMSPGPSGVNQLFNYSALTTTTAGYPKKYIAPGPYQYMFCPANYTLATTALPKSLLPHYFYFRSDTTGIYEVAAADCGNMPFKDLFMKFPVVINKKDSISLSYLNLTIGTKSPAHITGSVSIMADATGTLVTPSRTYNNTFRFHHYKYETYTTSFYGGVETSLTDSYFWYTPGIHGALLSIHSLTVIKTTSLGIITSKASQQWSEVYSDPNNPLGIEKNKDNSLINFSFQNPVSNQLVLKLNSPESHQSKLEITDLAGKTILTENSNYNEFTVNVSSLANGVYFIELSTTKGLRGTKKLMIYH